MKDAEDTLEYKYLMMITKVNDIYKLVNKCHVEQDDGIPIDSPNFVEVCRVSCISKITKSFRSTVFPLCSRS